MVHHRQRLPLGLKPPDDLSGIHAQLDDLQGHPPANRLALLSQIGNVTCNEFMLHFTTNDHDIVVFPDGRAIIKNTIDESLAKELYSKYIGDPS